MEHSAADEPAAAPRRRPSSSRRLGAPPPPPRGPSGDLLKRRLLALVIGVGVVILLLLLLRACLDARKARGYEDYLRDLDALTTTSSQLSAEFFGRFREPGEASKLEFQAQLGASRGTAEEILTRAEGLDTPDELSGAQADLELAFELRRDGVRSVVEEIEVALGRKGSSDAVKQIALDMRQFLASDVLYRRAQSEIEQALSEQDLSGRVPASQFLPEPIEPWLDDLSLAALIAGVAGQTSATDDSSRGTELTTTALRPGNTVLTPENLNTVPRTPAEVEVTVLNGGLTDERDVAVSYELLGGPTAIAGETTIPRVSAGQSGSTVIPVEGDVPTETELTLVVTVLPVPGETIIDNNESTYRVTFE